MKDTKTTKTTEETFGMPDDRKVDPRKVDGYREGQIRRHRGQGQ
jgi:hypothetical protein